MAGMASSDSKKGAHFTFMWKIKYVPRDGYWKSPVFIVQSMKMTKWYLNLLFSSLSRRIFCDIQRSEDDLGPESIEVEFELSFLDINGSPLIKRSNAKHFRKNQSFGFPGIHAIFDERKDEFYPEDTLTIRCRFWRKGTEVSKSELCFASTQFDEFNLSCIWAIKRFSSLQQGDKRIRILNLTTKGCPQLILTLSVADAKKCIAIRLEAPNITRRFTIEADISVLDAEGMVVHSKQTSTFMYIYLKDCELGVFEKSKLMSDESALLAEDMLLLQCKLKLNSCNPKWNMIEDYRLMDYPDSKRVQREESRIHFDEFSDSGACPFKEIVNSFKEDGTLSDISLRAGAKSFPVHKFVLSSRSPVFKAMFTKDMNEKTRKCIDIPDLDAGTLGRLLLYIYEDEVQELTWQTAANLFEAADKYELLNLKEKCSRFLKLNLSKSNVCAILVVADMHYDESLKQTAQEFIINNWEVLHSDAWEDFEQNHLELALQTCKELKDILEHSTS